MDTRMTQKIKAIAKELGADLVGFANIERFDEAPIKMSPKGIMPSAKTVIVCAVHHPDTTVELEGGEHGNSQIFESYSVQYIMNYKLDHISFQIARYLENSGYNAVPIVSSNIWRYRSYKELDAVFSPDMSHIYSSVCAGLSEMGWNGLALTPEYGPRNRFVSIITDAELEPSPLLPGGTLCDMCGECIKYCPTDAYRKEVNGVKKLNIKDRDGKVYTHRFANKNLWRCAWGEHFDLDLDDNIPDVVDEDVIIKRAHEKGVRGGEMGVCLKVCVPKDLRFKDESYSKYNCRRRLIADPSLPISREIYDKLSCIGLTYHTDRITIVSAETIKKKKGFDITTKMPGAKNVIVLSSRLAFADSTTKEDLVKRCETPMVFAVWRGLSFANYDMAKEIEKMGYSVMPNMNSMVQYTDTEVIWNLPAGEKTAKYALITDAPLEERDWFLDDAQKEGTSHSLKQILKDTATSYGADMLGVAPTERIDDIVAQLRPIKEGELIFEAKDKNGRFRVFDPEVTETRRKLYTPSDYMADAKSVIVIGSSYPGEAARRAGREPAEAVGPFIFAQAQAQSELARIGLEVVKALRRSGHKAVMTRDLIGMGSPIGSPKGEYSSPFDCSFEAAAAGLGEMTYSGTVYTEKYGVNQKFICIVTDAELEADSVKSNSIQKKCDDCRKCIDACPMKALKAKDATVIDIDGNSFKYIPLDTANCQWASRYFLTNADGDDCLGSKLNIMPKGEITVGQMMDALRQRDPVTKVRSGNAEKCITECPLI